MTKKKSHSSREDSTKDDESTKIVSKFLLKNSTVLSSLLDKQDFVNDAISSILSSRSNRQVSFELLTNFLSTLISSSSDSNKSTASSGLNSNLKKLYPVIDKFSSLLESIHVNEVESFVSFVHVLVIDTNYNSEILTYWNKSMNKILQTIIRILKRFSTTPSLSDLPDSYLFFTIIDVLSILYKSKLRSIMTQFSKQIRDLIIPFFSTYKFKNENTLETNQFSIISDLFALISATESSEIWTQTLQWVSANMVIILKEFTNSSSIGAIVKEILTCKILESSSGTTSNAANLVKLKQTLAIDHILKSLQGTDKVMAALTIYNQLALTFNKLLVYGNSSGYVNLDISIFVTLASSLLPISTNVDINDPANFIENEGNFSKIDSSMVVTEAKISTLNCLSTIFSLHSPLMIQYGQQIVQPVFSLLNKVNSPYNECQYVPRFLIAVLECVQSALPSIPSSCSSLLNMIKNGGGLLQLFTQQVVSVCSSRTGVNDYSVEKSTDLFSKYGVLRDSKESYVEHENDQLSVLIFNTIELLLIHAGTLLSHSILLSIHDGIKLLLSTMSKGLTVSPLPFDFKRLKRLQSERVRTSPNLILASLTLALTECLVYPNINKASSSKTTSSTTNIKGTHSDNIYLLQKVCRATTLLPYTQFLSSKSFSPLIPSSLSGHFVHNIVSEASRILHITSQLINPVAYIVPPINAGIISKHFHNRLKEVSFSSSTKTTEGVKRSLSESQTVPVITESLEILESNDKPEKKFKIEDKIELNETKSSAGLTPLSFVEASVSETPITTKLVTKPDSNDDDDDELPDIDMGSESE